MYIIKQLKQVCISLKKIKILLKTIIRNTYIKNTLIFKTVQLINLSSIFTSKNNKFLHIPQKYSLLKIYDPKITPNFRIFYLTSLNSLISYVIFNTT